VNIDNPLEIYSATERAQKIDDLIMLDTSLCQFKPLLKRAVIHAAERDFKVICEDDQDGRNLSPEQKDYLKKETDQGSLKQSKQLLGSLLATCLAGVIQ
jgi:hypothetical protein